MSAHDECLICGARNDTNWRSFCSLCATQTWGPAVVANFIEQLINCHDRLAEAEAKLRNIDQRGH